MKIYLLLLILLGFTVFQVGCEKPDGQYPLVRIDDPISGQVFNVYDTVVVRFEVSDDNVIHSVSVKIVDQNFIPVTASVATEHVESSLTGVREIPLTDKQIETGDYYVVVTASDGTNVQLEYMEIKIIGVPKARRGILFSDRSISNVSNVYLIDSLFQFSSLFVSPGQDVEKVCVNSLKDQFTLIGQMSPTLKTYSLSSKNLLWSDAAFAVNQIPRYLDLICFENTIYSTLYDREIRGFDSDGNLILNKPTGDYRPGKLFMNDHFLTVSEELVGTGTNFLFIYHSGTHSLLWQQQLPVEVVKVCALQNDRVLVFGNDDGNARVLEFDLQNNTYSEPRPLPIGRLLDAVKMGGQTYAIAHEDGLYAYTYSPNFLDMIRPSIVYQDVAYDMSGNRLIGAYGNTLEEMTVTGQLLSSITHTDSVGSLDIYYTR